MLFKRLAVTLVVTLATAAWAATPSLQDIDQSYRKGQHSVALDKVNAYLANNPKDAQGRFLKGLILTEMGRNAEAIKAFTELTEDYPDLPEPYNNLAVLYAAQGDYERARQSLESAIRTHPSYATAHENLGDIYAKLASKAYEKALQLDKSKVSAQTKLALIKDIFSISPRPPQPVPAREKTGSDNPPATPARVPDPVATAASAQATESSSKAQVAAKSPSTASSADQPASDAQAAVLAAVNSWAKAWAKQDVQAYLAAYDESFKGSDRDRRTWEAVRRERLTKPRYIKVELSQVKVSLNGDKATVRFRQRYESDILKTQRSKTLVLVKRQGQWKIVEEQ